jgi:hypothetical protein
MKALLTVTIVFLLACSHDNAINSNQNREIGISTGIIEVTSDGQVVSYLMTYCVCPELQITPTCISKDSVGAIEARIAADTLKYNIDKANGKTNCEDLGCIKQVKYMYCE